MIEQEQSPKMDPEQWRQSALSEVLQDRFGNDDPAMLAALQERVVWHTLHAGETLFHQGDASEQMYIVVNGRLRLHVPAQNGSASNGSAHNGSVQNGAERTLVEAVAGDTVGEFGLLTDEARSATATAARETNLVSLTSAAFDDLLLKYSSLNRAVMKIIIERQQRAILHDQKNEGPSIYMAIVPASPDLPINEFVEQLVAAWPQNGELQFVSSKRFDQLCGQPNAAYTKSSDAMHPTVTAWMGKLESQYRTLIYVADYGLTEWTKRCLNHVDQVLIVADPTANPQPSEAEVAISALPARLPTRLVLWHHANTRQPSNTAAWLDVRTVDAHHHVRNHDQAHMQRLARHLAGKAICLVLSGGGARGMAHAGVYRAFIELGIPIDCVGGTSVGAMAAATIANGMSYDAMLEEMGEKANAKSVMDYTLPITSLLESQKISQTCHSLCGDSQMEDLWMPCFCVSMNLTHSDQTVHRRGPLWRAVRASVSIPGIFTPVIEKGEILVDGGVINNFPIDVMAEQVGSPHIIAVNLSPPRESEQEYDLDVSISGWRVLASRFNPFRPRLASPTIMNTIVRTVTAASDKAGRRNEAMAELVIHPKSNGGGLLDFSNYTTIVDSGYTAALERLQRWREAHLDIIQNGTTSD